MVGAYNFTLPDESEDHGVVASFSRDNRFMVLNNPPYFTVQDNSGHYNIYTDTGSHIILDYEGIVPKSGKISRSPDGTYLVLYDKYILKCFGIPDGRLIWEKDMGGYDRGTVYTSISPDSGHILRWRNDLLLNGDGWATISFFSRDGIHLKNSDSYFVYRSFPSSDPLLFYIGPYVIYRNQGYEDIYYVFLHNGTLIWDSEDLMDI